MLILFHNPVKLIPLRSIALHSLAFHTNPTSTPIQPQYHPSAPHPWVKKQAFVSAPWEPSGVIMIIILFITNIINIVFNIVIQVKSSLRANSYSKNVDEQGKTQTQRSDDDAIATSDAGDGDGDDDGGDDDQGETCFVTDRPTCFPVAQSPEV